MGREPATPDEQPQIRRALSMSPLRREILQSLATLGSAGLMEHASKAIAQPTGAIKVDTKGLSSKIKFEAVLSGPLSDINGKYKLRVTELTLQPGGYVGAHNHAGPGIRQVASGDMTYVMPDKTVIYR